MTRPFLRLKAWAAITVIPAFLACPPHAGTSLTDLERRALTDTVLALFDSLSAIHTSHPDTGILRRLHPPGDTLLFIEGALAEQLTGDSLFRRVLTLHRPVHQMRQTFSQRRATIIDRNTAVLTAAEGVRWADTAGTHNWSGQLTLVVTRGTTGWVIRAYRG